MMLPVHDARAMMTAPRLLTAQADSKLREPRSSSATPIFVHTTWNTAANFFGLEVECMQRQTIHRDYQVSLSILKSRLFTARISALQLAQAHAVLLLKR